MASKCRVHLGRFNVFNVTELGDYPSLLLIRYKQYILSFDTMQKMTAWRLQMAGTLLMPTEFVLKLKLSDTV